MIKSILHERQHQIQTKFGILDWFYLIRELNTILSIDQDRYRKDFLEATTNLITLHDVAAKITTGNKVVMS